MNAELNRAETAARLAFGDFAADTDAARKSAAPALGVHIPAVALIALILIVLGLLA